MKNDKIALSDKASELVGKKIDLEAYLGGLAKKLYLMLEGNLVGERSRNSKFSYVSPKSIYGETSYE